MKASLAVAIFFFLAFVLFLAPTIFAQEKVVTVISESKWKQNKVNVADMNKRINDAAEQYKQYAPIPRIAFYDIGFPKDKAEFAELNGYGLLLISAMSQSEVELPIKRVYVVVDGQEIELKSLKQILTKEGNSESQIVKTFGLYRTDTLYLFPVYLRVQQADILIDFAQNRNGMKIASFDGEIPDTLKNLPTNIKPTEQKSFDDAMQRFMKREYSGFFETK
jgi:hypothetical protein